MKAEQEGRMRKIVFKRKKEILIHGGKEPVPQRNGKQAERRRSVKTLAFAAAMSLVLGTAMTAYGVEADGGGAGGVLRTVATDIFHRHMGSPDVEGGCYTDPIEHEHQGDAVNGGGCYTKPISHVHTGSAGDGGGCYGKEIPHTEHGPECYRKETHTHEQACLSGECTITYTETGVIDTYTDYCRIHGDTTHERRSAIASHSDCGKGEVDAVREVCPLCVNALTRVHSFINCGKQEGTTEVLECSKTIDGYEINCGYEEGEAEYYERECGDAVDGYGLGCGLDEDNPCGKLILTSQPGSDSTKVIISAKVEDLTGGKLILGSDPYLWSDREGNVLGSGESLEVDKNGDYFVAVSLENKDVDESGLHSSILVDSIRKEEPQKPTEAPTATPSATPAATADPVPTATADPVPTATADPAPTATADPVPTATADPAPVATAAPAPSAVPEDEPDKEEEKEEEEDNRTEDNGFGDENIKGGGTGGDGLAEGPAKEDSLEDTSDNEDNGSRLSHYEKRDRIRAKEKDADVSPSPKPGEKIKKETTKVTVSGNHAAEDREYRVGQRARKSGFFQSRAVRILTVAVSTVLLVAGLIFLLLYLMCSVRVYNDDGEGRMIYLGRRLVRKEDEEYTLVITEAMTEKSCTNRYCIKPGLFRLGKKEYQELIVYRDTKKAVVFLEKEMIVIL